MDIQVENNMENSSDNSNHGEHHRHRHHSGGHHSRRYSSKMKRKNKALQLTLIILACIAALILIGGVAFATMRYTGQRKLEQKATTAAPVLTITEPIVEEQNVERPLKEGEVRYKGNIYQYNSDIKTFAIMGIDHKGDMASLLASEMGGQSDMNFLAVMNPHTKKLQLISINRNTMTNIQRFDTDGNYVDTVRGQITLQHAYGTGGEDSCEKMVSAIDEVMYMVPIHGYFAMNMGAIVKLNDAVGGVKLKALEDICYGGTNIKAGEEVTLLGQDAFYYVKYRNTKEFATADKRMERDKQYLLAFLKKVKEMVKNDLKIPMNLYEIVKDYSVTNVSVDEMTYLVSQAVGYSIDVDDIYTVPGVTIQGDDEYEEFIVDEESLHDMIIEIFYEPVE